MGRQSQGATGRLRQSTTGPSPSWQATPQEAWGTDRTLFCTLLRNRRDETNASERPREYPEAAVDSRLRIQLKPDLPVDSGRRDTAGTEEPAVRACFGVYSIADCANRAAASPANSERVSGLFKPPEQNRLPTPRLEPPSPDLGGCTTGC